jgi:hypothetical protein
VPWTSVPREVAESCTRKRPGIWQLRLLSWKELDALPDDLADDQVGDRMGDPVELGKTSIVCS